MIHCPTDPYPCFLQPLPVWLKVEYDSFTSIGKGDTTDEQNQENNIGKCGSEVHNLPKQATKTSKS